MPLKETPLCTAHRALGARMVDYAGWSMPVMYRGILEEARAVRSSSGIFDISHMGRLKVTGGGARQLLQYLTSNDIDRLKPYDAQYSLLTNPTGGIIDDIIVYREDSNEYLIIVNASNSTKDIDWIVSHASKDETEKFQMDDQTAETAMIALQGPDAPSILSKLLQNDLVSALKRFQFANGILAGLSVKFCRTGYTGEDGYELIVASENAETLWNLLLDAGSMPCGLGARDALRIEAGYPLYGHEIDEATSPVEAGLMWTVKMDKADFMGKSIIASVQSAGPVRKLMGLVSEDRMQPRQGYTIYSDSDVIGHVTSGIFSPYSAKVLAMAYILSEHAIPGKAVTIAIRDKQISAIITPKKAMLDRSKSDVRSLNEMKQGVN